jgi:hypothetical protein
MTSNFTRRFQNFVKYVFDNKSMRPISRTDIGARLSILASFLFGHGVYVFSTERTLTLEVKKKYKINRGGDTEFMIVDEDGRHFNVNNSLWYWKWDALEDWHKIQEKKSISIKYYGWRVPVLGLFPNIVLIKRSRILI